MCVKRFRLLLEKNEFTKETLLRAVDEVYFIPEGTPLKNTISEFPYEKERIGLVWTNMVTLKD